MGFTFGVASAEARYNTMVRRHYPRFIRWVLLSCSFAVALRVIFWQNRLLVLNVWMPEASRTDGQATNQSTWPI